MDTQKTPYTDVPSFKLAKVGKDRERKRGGAAWWMGGRGAGSFAGVGGGAGGVAGLSAFKTLLILAMTVGLCATGTVLGLMMSSHSGSGAGNGDKKIFADKGPLKYDDLSGVVKTNNDIPNSLGYVMGSTDGLTPEERARRKAEEESRLAAEEAAKKKAEEDAAKQEAAAPAPAPAAPVAASNAGGSLGSKFGRLSGGLSGGSGLSGGIGGSFGHMGGPSGFNGEKGKKGALSSALASAATMGTHASARPMGAGMGQAFGQLRRTSSASSLAATRTGEASAAQAGAPFDTNSGGTSIDGSGITQGSPGASDTPPSGGTPGGAGGGSGAGPGGDTPPPSTPSVPWQAQLDAALGLLIGIVVLAAVAAATQNIPIYGVIISKICCVGICLAAAALAGIGIDLIAQYGQGLQGGILIAAGAISAAMCWASPYTMLAVDAIVALGAGALVATAGNSLSQSSSSASQINTK